MGDAPIAAIGRSRARTITKKTELVLCQGITFFLVAKEIHFLG